MIAVVTTAGLAILVTACATFLGVIVNLILGLHNKNAVIEVKQISNGRQDRMQKRIEDLTATLAAHGIVDGTQPPKWDGIERRHSERKDVRHTQ